MSEENVALFDPTDEDSATDETEALDSENDATDENTVDTEAETDAETPEDSTPKSKGRPRPTYTIKRDEKVLNLLAQSSTTGMTRSDLSDNLANEDPTDPMFITPAEAYLSLARLNQKGLAKKLRRNGKYMWVTTENYEAAVAEEVEYQAELENRRQQSLATKKAETSQKQTRAPRLTTVQNWLNTPEGEKTIQEAVNKALTKIQSSNGEAHSEEFAAPFV